MNPGQDQPGDGVTTVSSERDQQPGCLCTLTRAATQWVGSLTRARISAAGDPTNREARASRETAQDQVLEGWAADDGQGEQENRQEAVRRTRAWLDAAAAHAPLDLSFLSLTALPAAFPAGLLRLEVQDNQLTSLPNVLPTGLHVLYAMRNQLNNLPAAFPAGLLRLDVQDNQLTTLPDNLPATLLELNASFNRLTNLPARLPAGLEFLGASNNQLTSLPETLLTRLGPECVADLTGNPLSERVRTNLAAACDVPGYAGPYLFFSRGEGSEQAPPRPLPEVVADWLEGEPQVVAAWQTVTDEPSAQQYAFFLDRLRHTVNYGNPEFRQAVAEDLRQAAIRPRLREQYFELAFGASETCEDRITLTWNGMQSARLNADVEDGAYDERLNELIEQARVLFRLDQLEKIARQKVSSLRFVDEIEVYLAYQIKLRERLKLRHIAPDMRFFTVSYVTEDDLIAAETRVRDEEAAGFADYLVTRWQPLETVVSRIAPEAYAAMQERLADAMGEEFETRLQQRLADLHLTDAAPELIAAAAEGLGPDLLKEITREIKGALMRKVLGDRGLEL
ncbi:E3 ubiquitin--protein ligase [Bradyrhizobium sp. CCGUVB1N3]|nr:NEL-type E3 ubiquitin ligase domain-containing protein [Bradyrhizobium sp. CCGUVB1N3]MCP3471458.1 E3 ubiquitin--protein ligase [Bradyrhizobium sp. CCGUVB1N3]